MAETLEIVQERKTAAENLVEEIRKLAASQLSILRFIEQLKGSNQPYAFAVAGQLKLALEYNGEQAFVWSYAIVLVPSALASFQMLGRKWQIQSGKIIEHIPLQGFAGSVAGDKFFLPAGNEPLVFETALVTESRETPTLSGQLDAINNENKKRIKLPVPELIFRDGTDLDIPSYGITLDRLGDDDTKRLLKAISEYRSAAASENGAVFRADRINFSPEGRRLVNRFLFVTLRVEYAKSRIINFAPLAFSKDIDLAAFTVETTDHYIALSEQWSNETNNDLYFTYILVHDYCELLAKPSADAGVVQEVQRLYDKYGFLPVAQSLLRSASPEEVALFMSGASRDHSLTQGAERTTEGSFSTRLELMSLKERRAALKKYYGVERIGGGEKRTTWSEVRGDDPTPDDFLKWLDTNYADRRTVGLLAGDMAYLDYEAFLKMKNWRSSKDAKIRKSVSRMGLPTKQEAYDPKAAIKRMPTSREVRDAYLQGQPNAPKLERDRRRARYHVPKR